MSFLDDVVGYKREEARLRRSFTEWYHPSNYARRSLAASLSAPEVALIAEVKRASPSAGPIGDVDVAKTGRALQSAGAAALSVLTDGRYFGGSLVDLRVAKTAVEIPVLRKDFIVEVSQLRESLLYGADAVLLIAAILEDKTDSFVEAAHWMGLECIVEVHDRRDLGYALKSKARIIGVNNRDLRTLETDLSTFEELAPLIPEGRLKVAESGIKSREDVERMAATGADAVLVGSCLMKSQDVAAKARELLGVGS